MVKKYLGIPAQTVTERKRISDEIDDDSIKDRKPFLLGLIGFIFGILASLFLIVSGGIISAFGVNQGQNLVVLGTVAILLCIIGLPGSLIRHKKYGGIILILTGILILILIGGFGIITGILYIIGGILILRKTGLDIYYYLAMKDDTGKKVLFSCVIIFSILLTMGAMSSQSNLSLKPQNSGNALPSAATSYISPSSSTSQDFSSVTHGSVMTVSKNWDATAQNDGIIVYPDLRDASDKTVQWSNAELPVEILIYTKKLDSNYQQVKDQLVYSGTGIISSWKDGNMFMNGGLKVPYVDIHAPADQNFGITLVKIKLPNGRVIETEEPFTSLKAVT